MGARLGITCPSKLFGKAADAGRLVSAMAEENKAALITMDSLDVLNELVFIGKNSPKITAN
jgi:hypothetical protein